MLKPCSTTFQSDVQKGPGFESDLFLSNAKGNIKKDTSCA